MGITVYPPWDSILPAPPAADSPRAVRWRQQIYVLEILCREFPALYEGRIKAILSRPEADKLVDILRSGAFGYDFKHRMHFLVLGLEKGVSELSWDVSIPSVPTLARREKARFTPDSFAGLAKLRSLERAFKADLEKNLPPESPQRLGQILLSAILFGGLLSPRWVTPLLASLDGRVRIHGTLLWVDMVRKKIDANAKGTSQDKDDVKSNSNRSAIEAQWEISRRWVADPLTTLMIHRLQRSHSDDFIDAGNLGGWDCLRAYLRLLQSDSGVMPASEKQLISWAATRIGLFIPGFLVSYATEQAVSVTLPEHVWARLCTKKAVRYTKVAATNGFFTEEVPKTQPLPVSKSTVNLQGQEKLLHELMVCVLPPDKSRKRNYAESIAAVSEFLERNASHLVPVIYLLAVWSIDLLSNRKGRGFARLRPSSVRRYLQAIGKGILVVVGSQNAIGLDASDYEAIYEGVLSTRSTSKERCYTASRLAAFHWFLVQEYSCPPVDITDLGGRGLPKELSVDANLISPESFEQCLRVLGWEVSEKSRQREIQCLVALLGFRCGLRRREALTVRIGDLIGDEYPELIVRTSIFAATKTSSATRRLPLRHLLDEAELLSFLQWREKRKVEEGSEAMGALLFALAGSGMEPLDENWVFPDIENSFRQVTGDMSLTFHHLRHSFATWLMLLFFMEKDDQRTGIESLKNFQHELLSNKRRKLISDKQFPNKLDRSTLYWIALLCGHASPSITMLHYIHLFDWLLADYLSSSEVQPKLTEAAMVSLTGLSRAMIYKIKNKRNDWYSSYFLKGKVISRSNFMQLTKNAKCSEPDLTPLIQQKMPAHWPMEIIQAVLYGSQVEGMTAAQLSKRYGVPLENCTTWINNAYGLKNRTTTIRKKKMRHCNSAQVVFPHAPREKEELTLASLVYLRLANKFVEGHDEARFQVYKFLQKYDVLHGGMRIVEPGDAREYLEMVRLAGVPQRQLLIRHMPSVRHKNEDEQKASSRMWWANQLKIPVNQFIDNEQNNLGGGENGSILIQICASEKRRRASYGFRYAMYMLAIIGVLKKIAEQMRMKVESCRD